MNLKNYKTQNSSLKNISQETINKVSSEFSSLSIEDICMRNDLSRRQIIKICSLLNLNYESKKNKEMKLALSKTSKRFWNSISQEEKEQISKRRKATNISRYGVSNGLNKENIQKVKNTIEKNGGYSKINKKAREKYLKNIELGFTKKKNISKIASINKFGQESWEILHNENLFKESFNKLKNKSSFDFCQEYNTPYQQTLRAAKNFGVIFSKSSMSSYERKFSDILNKNNINFSIHYFIRHNESHYYEYDFIVQNTLVEINPTFTHNSTDSLYDKPLDKNYHKEKTDFAVSKGFSVINVFSNDDIYKIVEILKPKKKIFARKCEIKKIKSSSEFENLYHLHGSCSSSIKYGLFYNNELVEIMTFSKSRFTKDEYELVRLCSKHGIVIVGGASKLLSRFINDYNPSSIVSFQDYSHFQGNVYKKLGFEYLGHSLSYFWDNYKIQLSRYQTQKHKLKNILENFDESLSETKNMEQNGFKKVFTCGNKKFIMKLNKGGE